MRLEWYFIILRYVSEFNHAVIIKHFHWDQKRERKKLQKLKTTKKHGENKCLMTYVKFFCHRFKIISRDNNDHLFSPLPISETLII